MKLSKSTLGAAVAIAMGTIAVPASADVMYMDWTGIFTMLDGGGAAMANSSITAKGANQYQTPVTGTMKFDPTNGMGAATLVPFDFFSGTAQAAAVGINMQAIGNGSGGPGPYVLSNMLFNWNGAYGIPVSLILDGSGMFAAMATEFDPVTGDMVIDQADVAGTGAAPASDGTYINATWGYLGVGPIPMASTEWDLNATAACDSVSTGDGGAGCMNINPSGELDPVTGLVTDNTPNGNEYAQGDGYGVGGIPMWDGPFKGSNANFDILTISLVGGSETNIMALDTNTGLNTEIAGTHVPVPAAVWLFGSGLLGLVGVARRKKAA